MTRQRLGIGITAFFLLWVGGTLPLGAQQTVTVPPSVEEAHGYYEDGRLNEAAQAYQSILDSGVTNGWLHYDLGNALFRQGKLGEAILEYERALRYLPRFGDLRHNLEYARNLTVDEVLRPAKSEGVVGFVYDLHSKLNLRESLWTVALLWWIFVILLILGWFTGWSDRLTWLRRAVMALLLIGMVSTTIKIIQFETVQEGVIIAPEIEAKTGPGADYSPTAVLHEGTKVRIGEFRSGWVRIRLPNNITGWISRDNLGLI